MSKRLKNLWNLIGFTLIALVSIIGLAIGFPLLVHLVYNENCIDDYRYFRFVQELCNSLEDLLII